MTYTHLTQDERYQIYILKKAGHKQSEIAEVMGRSRSTISREIKRNSGGRGYRPKQAQQRSLEKQARKNGATISAETWAFAEDRLRAYWSPEQISGYSLRASMHEVTSVNPAFFLITPARIRIDSMCIGSFCREGNTNRG